MNKYRLKTREPPLIAQALCIMLIFNIFFSTPNIVAANENVKFSFSSVASGYDMEKIYNYNIAGSVNTSYGNRGYTTIFKIGNEAKKVSGLDGGKSEIDGVLLTTAGEIKKNGSYVKVIYTIKNTNVTSKELSLGEGLDIQIDKNDKAPVTLLDNGKGFYMEDSGHRFDVFLRNTYGSTDITGLWIGSFSDYKNRMLQNNFFDSYEHSYSGGDSAAFWYWKYTLAPGEVKTFSHLIGIGELNNPPQISDITGVGTHYCTGDTINISGLVYDPDDNNTVSIKYGFDNGAESVLQADIITNGEKKSFSGKLTVPSIDFGKHILTIYAEDNKGSLSNIITKEFVAHNIPESYVYNTSNGIENGIRYNQCINCGEIINKEYLLVLNKSDGIASTSGDGYYKEGDKVIISAKLEDSASGFKQWLGSNITKDTSIYTMPAQAMSLTATAFYRNVYTHYIQGLKNQEGNNSAKDAFLIDTTYKDNTSGVVFSPDKSYATTIPNGFSLRKKFINTQMTVNNEYDFGTKITQPKHAMNFEYDYYPNSYSITYNLDGGINDSTNPSTYNVLYGVSLKNPTRAGYTFTGWYDENDNKITGINEGCNTKFSSADDLYAKLAKRTTGNRVLTAKWTPNVLTVKYHNDGGTSWKQGEGTYINVTNKDIVDIEALKYDSGYSSYNLDDVSRLIKTGYHSNYYWFVGSKNSSIRVSDSKYFLKAQNLAQDAGVLDAFQKGNVTIDLYPDMLPNTYTLTFDYGKKPVTTAKSKTITYDNVYGELPNPQCTGWTFKGWNTKADGTGDVVTEKTMCKDLSNVTIYAQWQYNPIHVKLPQILTGDSKGNSQFRVKCDDLKVGSMEITVPNSFPYKQAGKADVTANITSKSGNNVITPFNKVCVYDITANGLSAGCWQGSFSIGMTLNKSVLNFSDVMTSIGQTANLVISSADNGYDYHSSDKPYYSRIVAFIPDTTATYCISSVSSFDTYGRLYDENMNSLTYNDDGAENRQFKFSYKCEAGKIYYIAVGGYKDSSSNQTLAVKIETSN